RTHAVASLGMSASPTEDGMAALLELAGAKDHDLAATATLALGNAARRMRGSASQDSADGVSALIDGLERATTDDERVLYLDALGNAGDGAVLPVIEPYLAASS